MSDCLLHVKSNQIEITHHKFVRSEAAFALARWQCEYAPKTSVGDEDTLTSTWRGLHALKTAIHTLFSYEVEETDSGGKGSSQNKKRRPNRIEYGDEESEYLRNAACMAISQIKAKDGTTPVEVVST